MMKRNLPSISLITPSYNQAEYLERTINSVISQKYPELEYIIMDGGSSDNTLKILKKYNSQIIWESKKDRGQADAINKGIIKSTGDIISYLNSDDILLPECLEKVSYYFSKNPDCQWVTGDCHIIDKNDNIINSYINLYKRFWLKYLRSGKSLTIVNFISQPGTFWRRKIMNKIGFFNPELHFAMDYDFWLRIMNIYKLGYIDEYISGFRVQDGSKSFREYRKLLDEGYQAAKKNSKVLAYFHRIHDICVKAVYSNIRK